MLDNDQKIETNILNSVNGFKEAVSKKEELERNGSNFSEGKGLVRKTINSLHPKRIRLRVEKIRVDTPSTKTLQMVSVDGKSLPPFQAGQYINLFVSLSGVLTARPYSISSSPTDLSSYELTIKRAEGGFVSPYLLDDVKIGQEFESTGPMGSFHHNPLFHGLDLVFLAGGSGIAPAMSMLKSFLASPEPFRFHIIYSNSYEDDVIFINELRNLAAVHENFLLTEFLSRNVSDAFKGYRGRLDFSTLQRLVPDAPSKMYYVCGPTPFNEHCADLLSNLGVKSGRILIESNGPPNKPETLEGWPNSVLPTKEVNVTVTNQKSFKAKVGEPLLNSLERNGFFTENACRSGECSLCRVKLKSGEVFSPPEAKIRKSDKKFGWIHSCVAFPVTDVEIQL
ncbi:flavodoxin reductase [Leptospira congkakensis]|uniref:Flavodoxin reductase n=1 Tax=Leptospira congkakensis TaxID=2484932 RepID=A0A4Z1AGW1_9LEPT|nr:FAD-binding oxidoreductase [Leptospira congkakensis]TGL87783.1 flavodoxin reductase [Leptospira congkakensis]TGL89601.1 flavodoxin reductase [Leptospira congkakensis]TGL95933.1 flavodoxin reductase [Leptospira congkakensis]